MQTARNYFSRGQVIVNFVRKFVAMAIGVGRGKFLMTPSDSLGPEIKKKVNANSAQLFFTGAEL